jgi:hypothetical protein
MAFGDMEGRLVVEVVHERGVVEVVHEKGVVEPH